MNFLKDTANLVYHYTSRESAFEKILTYQKLKFNPFIFMKDPRESKMWNFSFTGSRPISTETCISVFKPVSEDEITDAAKYGCKLLCFSKDNLNRIRNNKNSLSGHGFFLSRMWAQYGQGHSGVCFAFDREELDNRINEELGTKGKIYCGSVEYTENELELYHALNLDADAIAKVGIDLAVEKHIDLFYNKLFLQKDADWRDENEYRWIIKTQDMNPEYVSIDSSIRAIFLGIDFPAIYESIAIECANKLSTQLFRLKWYNGKAGLSEDMSSHSA